MKRLAKTFLQTVAPQQFAALSSSRANKQGQRSLNEKGVPLIAELYVRKYGAKVQAGPFEGMIYLDQAIGSSYIPKLIGSYECELHEIIANIIEAHYDVVIDVGSAEGYYAVGLATKLGGKPPIYAFDTDKVAQNLCRELAIKNHVESQVKVSGYCDASQLQNTIQGRCLVVCDCEGYEIVLLDPSLVPSLSTCEILVELHDNRNSAITPTLQQRFSSTHDIQWIDTSPRDPANYPTVHFLDSSQQNLALSEFRGGPQQWAYMIPKPKPD